MLFKHYYLFIPCKFLIYINYFACFVENMKYLFIANNILKMNCTMRTYVRYFTHNLFLKQWISTRRTLKPRCPEWVKWWHNKWFIVIFKIFHIVLSLVYQLNCLACQIEFNIIIKFDGSYINILYFFGNSNLILPSSYKR